MPIVNCTGLTIRLYRGDGDVYRTFDPADAPVQLRSTGASEDVDDVEVETTYVTAVHGLPEPADGTVYIVPQPVAQVLNRPDLVTPDTGPTAIREDDGTVYAVQRLFSVVLAEDAETEG